MNADNLPIVRGRIDQKPGGPRRVALAEPCPYCRSKRDHVHGWPETDGDGEPGVRVAHCLDPAARGEYRITIGGDR